MSFIFRHCICNISTCRLPTTAVINVITVHCKACKDVVWQCWHNLSSQGTPVYMAWCSGQRACCCCPVMKPHLSCHNFVDVGQHLNLNLKQNWLQFVFVVTTTTIKQQKSNFCPQIQRTEANYHIYTCPKCKSQILFLDFSDKISIF